MSDRNEGVVFQLAYSSTAARYLYPFELSTLLETSRCNNARRNITGMLVYGAGNFLQLLEGEETAVRKLYQSITRDERHKWVRLLMTGSNRQRDFADWSMAYRELDEKMPPPEGWSSFLDSETAPGQLENVSQFVRKTFCSFRDQLAN